MEPAIQSSMGLAFSRTYTNLPPHTFVTISAVFWYFDVFNKLVNYPALLVALENGGQVESPFLDSKTDFTTEDGGIVGVNDLSRDHVGYGLKHRNSILKLTFINFGIIGSNIRSFGFRELHIHLSNYSDLMFPGTCHISEDVSSLQWLQCPCPIGQAQDPSGNCASCAVNCDFCFGTAPEECLACSAGTFWDGTKCNTCHLMCQTCAGTTSNDCLSCKYGFYNYGNNTCMESCESPFVVEKIGTDLLCNRPCDSSQFYWAKNETCSNKCDFPLLHAPDENGIEYCWNPCPNPYNYLYANGSCLSTCQSPLLPKLDREVKFCVNPCPETDYLYPNRSCMSACPSPLLSRSEPGAKYCWNPCLSTNYFLYNNGSCDATCPAPLISRSEPGFKYCYTPCGSVGEYIYDNRSCGTSCSSPLVSRTEPMIAQYCSNPCPYSSNYFLYPNGSCLAECNWPLLSRSEPGVRYCYSPCADSSAYIYPDGTCKDKCPYPLMTRSEPGFYYCFTPCKSDEYLYNDQSCYDYCDSPLIKRLEPGGVNYCNTPCHTMTDYVYQDGICHSVCEYPYKVVPNIGYKICSMNMDEIQTHQAYSLANTIDITNMMCGVGGLLTGFVIPEDPTSMLMWSLLKMLRSPRFMDVNFSVQLAKIFAKQNDNYLADGYMSSSSRRRVLTENNSDLGKFSFYNIPENFLGNYWQQLIVFGILISLILVSKLSSYFLTNSQYLKYAKNLNSALQWNIVLMFFCGTYGDLILYSALEFQTASFNNLGSIMGFLTCLLLVILAIYVSFKILYVINSIRKAKIKQDTGTLWPHNRVFFEIYKSDQAIQHIFLFIYLMRVTFFNVLLGYIFKSPLAQALLLNFMSFLMMIYLFSKTPIKDKICLAQHVLMESSLFAYNLCLLILVLMDLAGVQAESTRAFFGGVMVFFMMMAPLGTAVLIAYKLTLRTQVLYQQYKARKDALKLVGSGFKFKKVRARGKFVIGENHNESSHINSEALNPTESRQNNKGIVVTGNSDLSLNVLLRIFIELDESNLVIVPHNQNQDFVRETSRNYYISSRGRRFDGEGSSMNIHLESNMESSIVQIKTQKGPNLKRRKINIFKNDDYLPD